MSYGALLNQSGTIENKNAVVGKHGETGFGSAVTARMRFQKTTKTIMNTNGELEPIDGIAFVASDCNVEIGSRLTYNSEAYRVIKQEDVIGRGGSVHHKELMVQSWNFAA